MTEKVSSSAHGGHWLGYDGKKISFSRVHSLKMCYRQKHQRISLHHSGQTDVKATSDRNQALRINTWTLNTRLNTTSSSQLNISLLQSKISQQRKVNGNCSNHNAGHPNLVLRLNAVPSIGFRLPATRRKVEQTRRPTQCGVGASRLGAVITRSGREP